MDLRLEIINPLEHPEWDQAVLSAPGISFSHSSSWARVLSESYGFRPLSFTLLNGGAWSGCLSVMEINSTLTGRRGISLPFTDFCEPLTSQEPHFDYLLSSLIDHGRKAGWKYIELRGGNEFLKDIPFFSSFYRHTLDLSSDESITFRRFRDSTRSTIRKTVKQGVETGVYHSLDSVRQFYVLNCMTRQRHGIPPQPFVFFQNLFDHIIATHRGMVVLASLHGKVVAGAVFLHFGEEANYKYSASDYRYRHLGATALVLWEAIRWYGRNGFKVVDFGRTDLENKGLRVFKRGFCRHEEIFKYYRYDLSRDKWREDHSSFENPFPKLVRGLPIPLLRMIGALLYRHIG
jgi:hypothetical protein